MRLSQRITGLTGGGSDGWEVFNRARAMVSVGEAVTELTIGDHDIRTHPSILAAMNRAATGGHTGYAMVPGTSELRDVVADRVATRTGVPTTRDNVLITPGGQSALFSAHHAVCDEGDTALFLDPYYATYPGTIRAVGAVAQPVQTRAADAFQPRSCDLDAAASAAGSRARSLLINSPNNPTGAVYGRDTMRGIAEVCEAHDLWLISDEVYDTQVWKGSHRSARALPGMENRALVVGSMSKSHAMTGSRCGWIVGPSDVISHLITLATHTTYGVPGFIQDAAAFALTKGAALEEEIAAPFRRRRALAASVLAASQNGGPSVVGLVPAQGTMYLMLDIRGTGLSGEAFATELLERHRIAVMPGESFGIAASGHVRVAMTVADEVLAKALETLCRFAQSLAGHNA